VAHLKGMLHQEPHVKTEDHFFEKHPYPGKCLPIKKISGHFCVKNFIPMSALGLNHPCLSTLTSGVKELRWLVRVGSWDVFTKSSAC